VSGHAMQKRVSALVALGASISLLFLLAAAPAVAAATAAGPAAAPPAAGKPAGPPAPEPRSGGKIFGIAPAAIGATDNPHRPTAAEFAGTRFAAGSNLTYHGGQVMHTNKTYLIYWAPSAHPMSATYENLITGFFQNVAADSRTSTNVYASDTQYTDGAGPVQYASTYGASWVDSLTAIPDHCSGQYKAPAHVSGCVTDADIQAEVSHAIASNPTWDPPGPGVMYFVFTPQNVGSCFDTSSGTCAFTYYCAYHSNYTDAGRDVIYANQPYTDTSGVGSSGSCDSGEHPNNDWADATINVASHEHNEAITDPHGTAWYDSAGNENGDKCAWNFGTPLGSTSYGAYNQAIGTGKYYLQQEWSNASSGCVLTYGSAPPVPPTITGLTPASGPVGTSVTVTGTAFTGATSVKFNGKSASFSVKSATSITATVPSGATTGVVTVTTSGGTGSSPISFTVTAAADFSLSASPTSRSVSRGGTTSYGVTVNGVNGFSGSVSLTVTGGMPNRTTASFSPGAVGAGGTSTLTIKTNTKTNRGTYLLNVTGTSGGVKRSVQLTLVVA